MNQTEFIADNRAIAFAEFTATECKLMPDGWHYKGEVYSPVELYELFIKERL